TTGDWLARRLSKTRNTIQEAQTLLDEWCQEENPYDPQEKYTPSFFRRQWQAERAASISTAKDTKVRQQLELGRLLCLEDLALQTWLGDANNEGAAFARLNRVQSITEDIVAQRKIVGLPECFSSLTRERFDLLLKVWYTKTEVRTRYLALRLESQPLDPEKKAGGGSTLGTHEKERIIAAIQKRTRTLKKHLTSYNKFAQSFRDLFPNRPTSPVRRAMRWATNLHARLWTVVHHLTHSEEVTPASITTFIHHNILRDVSSPAKVRIVKGLLHNEYTRICQLQLRWHVKLVEVFMNTRAQTGDEQLIELWMLQGRRIQKLRSIDFGSIRGGDFENLMPLVPVDVHEELNDDEQVNDLPQAPEPQEDLASEVDEDEWEDVIDEGMLQNMNNETEEPR
ncbi:hypothetical protein DFH28DRAFT_904410, partial [Melampsora americana]